MGAELYLMEMGDGRFAFLLCDDRTKMQMPALAPAEALIAFSELDYTDYRKVVRWLREGHPLFEERIDIPVSNYEDFAVEAVLLKPDLCENEPVSGFVVTDILHRPFNWGCSQAYQRILTFRYRILTNENVSCIIIEMICLKQIVEAEVSQKPVHLSIGC